MQLYVFKHQLDLFSFIGHDLPAAWLTVSVVVVVVEAVENDFSIRSINNYVRPWAPWIVNKTVNGDILTLLTLL